MNAATLFDHTSTSLTAPEQEQLSILEQTIERGLKTFVDVGTALMVVRDSKLYRQDFDTFEGYCQKRWNMGKSRVYQMIDAAMVVENLQKSTIVDFPVTESQARPLAQLEPEQQREAWAKAVETAPNGKVTAAHVQSVVDEYEEQAEELAEDEEGYDYSEEGYDEPVEAPKPHVTHNSGNNEWYTPQDFIEAARLTLGTIELDPATSTEANATVRATTYYTIDDDGLSRQWCGKVWMNPPYAADLVGRFIDKLILHFQAKDVDEAIVLVNNATETRWFQALACHASAICFPASRIRFWSPNGGAGAPLQGQAILYLGLNAQDFLENFSYFGLLVTTALVQARAGEYS